MSNLERLKEALAAEAEAQAAEILAEAGRRAAALRAEAQAQAARVRDELLSAARREIEVRQRQGAAEERLLQRQALLKAKAGLVAEALAGSKQRLADLLEAEYRSFVSRLIQEEAPAGQVRVRFNERDRARLDEAFLRDVTGALSAAGRSVELVLDPEPAPIAGGALLSGEGFEIDCSLERLLAVEADAVEPEVARVLFG